jgi:hypothetical protein
MSSVRTISDTEKIFRISKRTYRVRRLGMALINVDGGAGLRERQP